MRTITDLGTLALFFASVAVLLAGSPRVDAPDVKRQASGNGEMTLFAFDDQAIPLRDNLQLTLVPAEKHPQNPVLRCGPPGSPDHGHAVLYGSVIRVGGKFRMWYLGMIQRELQHGQAPGYWRPMCYAESGDGLHWVKPELGLVELNGSRRNNICLIRSADADLTRVDDYLTVLYEPDDPVAARAYKAAFIAHYPWEKIRGGVRDVGSKERRLGAMVCATSSDGLTWQVLGDRPCVAEKFEVSGLYHFGDFYYATGQQITPWAWLADGAPTGRVVTAYRSPDLLHWSSAKSLAFARPGQTTVPPVPGEQTHMGAGVWNRGNVLVGLYGMWQDGPAQRPKGSSHLYGVRIDLGLILSNDGLHFREPVPNFKIIAHGGPDQWDSICLLQGHAFANVGDHTYLWYSHWDCEGHFRSQEIGLAMLRRDGFGYLARRHRNSAGNFITCPIDAKTSAPRLWINAEGASRETPLRIELLDRHDRPIAGYSGADAAKIVTSGTRQAVIWPKSSASRGPAGGRYAVRVGFPVRGDVRVYAFYVDQ